jgi:hypothetical protein
MSSNLDPLGHLKHQNKSSLVSDPINSSGLLPLNAIPGLDDPLRNSRQYSSASSSAKLSEDEATLNQVASNPINLASTSFNNATLGADFNSDGKTDLVWRNYATGENAVWLMNGTNLTSGVLLNPVSDLNWRIEGTGDFNGDGKTDLVWRNYATGENAMWLMNGTSLNSGVLLNAVPDINWHISGTGDFNGDGKTDLVWRNYATGENAVWLMNGTNLNSGVLLNAVPDINWHISGTGDFNGDGKTDLLWRNYATGENAAWLMNGTNLNSGVFLNAVPDLNWSSEGTGDFNGDGKTDLLWRNYATGDNAVWLMNGANIASTAGLMPVSDQNWQMKAKDNPTGSWIEIPGATGTTNINGKLSTNDITNPTHAGSYADDYQLKGFNAGQQVQINLFSSDFDTYLQLINAATGQVIAYNDDANSSQNSQLMFTVQSGMNYLVRATSYDSNVTGNYSLRASKYTAISRTNLSPGQTLSGNLTSTDGRDTLRFGPYADDYLLTGVTSGQQVQINLSSSDFDTYLELVNANTGQLIDYNDDSYNSVNSQLSFTVASGINYLVRATSYDAGVTGSYTISTVGAPPPPPIPNIGINQTVSGSLSNLDVDDLIRSGHYADDYQLNGVTAGQRVQVSLNSWDFDAYLEVINASTGDRIDYNDDAGVGTDSQLNFTAQSGINYLIRVTSYDEGETGSYTLRTNAVAPPPTITANQNITGSLSTNDAIDPTYHDDYLLGGVTAGQQIRINLASSSFDTYLQVLDAATGEFIDGNDDANYSTTDSEVNLLVQSGTNYLIRVASYDSDVTGSYTLSTNTTASVPTITGNQSISGTLSTTDATNPTYHDDYILTGVTAGQQIQVNLNSTNFDTYLELVDASTGNIIDNNDDAIGTNSQLNFTVQSGTNYLIRATSYDSNITGSYTLTTTGGSDPTPPPPPPNGDWFSQLRDSEIRSTAANLAADGQLSRNDMLAIFRNAEDNSAIDVNEQSDLRLLASSSNEPFSMPDYVKYLSTRVSEDVQTNMSATQFESDLVGRWFLGTVAPTARFDDDGTGQTYYLSYTQVQGTLFGSAGQARIGDIDQGYLGDCAFLSALGATFGPQYSDAGNQSSSVINSMIIDNGDNTYTVRFYSNSEAEYVTVDRRLATYNGELFGASANGSSEPNNSSNILWAPLVERAYAQWREWREGEPGYNLMGNGDNCVRPLQFVTGRAVTRYDTSNITFNQLQTALNSGHYVETGRIGDSTQYIVGGHAYAVTNAYVNSNGQQRVVVRNPWGRDGRDNQQIDGANDGFIDLSFSDFLSNMNYEVAIA